MNFLSLLISNTWLLYSCFIYIWLANDSSNKLLGANIKIHLKIFLNKYNKYCHYMVSTLSDTYNHLISAYLTKMLILPSAGIVGSVEII